MAVRTWTAIVMGALLLGAISTSAMGGNRAAVRKQVESSLLVSGTVTIAPDGSVMAHTLDPDAPLGEPLVGFLDGTIGKWRFEPVKVDGKVVTAKVPMHLRLVAKPVGDGSSSVSIASSHFGSSNTVAATDVPRSIALAPPRFPRDALSMGGKGTVYLIVQVGRDGKVVNVDAEQVNLRVVGTESQMAMLRKSFTSAALRAAREWAFQVPTTGEDAGKDAWLVRVPVEFVLTGPREKQRDKSDWDSYIPGPRNMQMPWAQEKLRIAGNPDALPEGGIYPLRQGATLLNPPAG